jgi:adenylyltransferase/sulfurtransferase
LTSLASKKVLVIGAGGLGSPVALALAQAGVGLLGLCDPDVVDLSNLHRQLLHSSADIGAQKVLSAARTIEAAAAATRVVPLPYRFEAKRAALLSEFHLVVEGTDDAGTKFLVNDLCVRARKPFVIGGALRWSGQVLAWVPDARVGCYRCLFEEAPPPEAVPTCQQAGILGPVCGVIGGLQAAAALALLGEPTSARAPRPGGMTIYDGQSGRLRAVAFRLNPECRVCGTS